MDSIDVETEKAQVFKCEATLETLQDEVDDDHYSVELHDIGQEIERWGKIEKKTSEEIQREASDKARDCLEKKEAYKVVWDKVFSKRLGHIGLGTLVDCL
ncbi:hypothetical protein L7F22_060119 [Adiantum nelumboides]|nr:hypothetical protein [Adiantum nelumboides]